MKLAIIGTRGIPNQYGGFEQFADELSQGLVKRGHEITVYCSGNHSYQESQYNGVNLIHKKDPENKIGTTGQFIYDLNCIWDAKSKDFDIIYLLGYTSSSIWQKILNGSNSVVITNMDGLEWKRSKYSKPVQRFLQFAERLAVKYSDFLVADSIGIQTYLKNKYSVDSTYHPYGSYVFSNPNIDSLEAMSLKPYLYDVLIARFEPENNIEMVLNAFADSKVNRDLILVGNYSHTSFGQRMYDEYSADNRIKFVGAIYDQELLNNVRYYSNLYYHGHSVGGTNPSLLEALGSSALICYHDNEFNKTIVGDDGFSFSSVDELVGIIERVDKKANLDMLEANLNKVKDIYEWEKIIEDYEQYFISILPEIHNP